MKKSSPLLYLYYSWDYRPAKPYLLLDAGKMNPVPDPMLTENDWQCMAAGGRSKMPEFLSTHPPDETGSKKLAILIPEAKEK